jgi:hypothetical protein
MLFGSKVDVNQLRKRMLAMECDTHRLELTERWRELSSEIGFGSGSNRSSRESVRRWGHWLAPVGAFVLSRWLRAKSKDSSDQVVSSNQWGFLGQFFEWMAKLSPQDKH